MQFVLLKPKKLFMQCNVFLDSFGQWGFQG